MNSLPNATIGSKCMPQILASPHKDFIYDIAFDHYGRRIATCSADRTVKIFDLNENGEWTTSNDLGSGWKAPSGVTSISWAHPEFGQLLATSGADGLAMIWEERADSSIGGGGGGGDANSVFAAQTPVTRWTERARLADARKSLSCVKFAPRHLRLQMATASADGVVRIYEAVDVMNLNQWLLKNSIEVEPDNTDLGVRCLDWCQGRFEAPTLVVGDSSGNVNIYRYSDASRNWRLYLRLDGHVNPRRGVLDVAWSPDVGRSYHLISSCGRDGLLKVHKLKKSSNSGDGTNGSESRGLVSALEVESSQVLNTKDEVWRCSWNVTGTVLASSGDGGVVELWKSDFKGNWKCVSKVNSLHS
jgi:nucleoporin SEH1